MTVRVYSEYDQAPRVMSQTVDFDESKTRQSERNDADINVIIARYEKTGVMPLETREALFIDVSQLEDYQTVLEHVRRTEEFFASLPAGTRAEFDNSASVFLDQAVDPASREKLVRLGLLEAEAAKPAPPAAVPEPAK